MKLSSAVFAMSLALCACSVNIGTPAQKFELTDPGTPVERDAAVATANELLLLIDNGKVSETWPRMGEYGRSTATESQWTSTVNAMRFAAGSIKKRRVIAARFTTHLEASVPVGHYFVVFYESEYSNATLDEKVILNLEQGQWKLDGYFLSKHVQGSL